MVLVCEKCGGKNTIFGNEGTKYCAFCGNQLDLPKEENKSSTISHSRIGTDLEIILDYLRNGSVGKFVLPLAQLKEVHLKNALLAQANLNGANFEKSVLSGANFQGAILHDTNLSWANLDNVDLTNADLSRANLKGVKFNNSLLIGSNLSQADLSFCDLSDANMSNANISGTNLQGAKMFDTVLNGVDLTKALTIEQARLCVDLHDHDFRGLKDRSFDIGFYGGQLIKANFEGTRLNAPTFEGTNLEYANFQNADLTGFTKRPSFVSANLSGANFKKALLTNATFELANLSNTNFEGADLRGANFSRANIKGAKFKNANLDGAQGKGCYLTTVCVDAMNLPDDCHELETLRKFRDGFVSKTQKGKDLIKEYYDIAPKIIDAIKMTVNEESIFKDLYKSINEIVLLIDVMEYEKAFEAYCKLTLNLKYQYLK